MQLLHSDCGSGFIQNLRERKAGDKDIDLIVTYRLTQSFMTILQKYMNKSYRSEGGGN